MWRAKVSSTNSSKLEVAEFAKNFGSRFFPLEKPKFLALLADRHQLVTKFRVATQYFPSSAWRGACLPSSMFWRTTTNWTAARIWSQLAENLLCLFIRAPKRRPSEASSERSNIVHEFRVELWNMVVISEKCQILGEFRYKAAQGMIRLFTLSFSYSVWPHATNS